MKKFYLQVILFVAIILLGIMLDVSIAQTTKKVVKCAEDTSIFIVKTSISGDVYIVKEDTLNVLKLIDEDGVMKIKRVNGDQDFEWVVKGDKHDGFTYVTSDDNDTITKEIIIKMRGDGHNVLAYTNKDIECDSIHKVMKMFISEDGETFSVYADSLHNIVKGHAVIDLKEYIADCDISMKADRIVITKDGGDNDTLLKEIKEIAWISKDCDTFSIHNDSMVKVLKKDILINIHEVAKEGHKDGEVIIMKIHEGEGDSIIKEIRKVIKVDEDSDHLIKMFVDEGEAKDVYTVKKYIDEDGKEAKINIYVSNSGQADDVSVIKNMEASEDDITALKAKGVDIDSKSDLKIDKFVLHFESEGYEFKLKFESKEEGKLVIKMYDEKANVLYEDDLKTFEGKYEMSLDQVLEGGTYFVAISIGKKSKVYKVENKRILE